MNSSETALRRFASWVVRHRFQTTLIATVVTTLLASQAMRLRIEISPDEQLPQSHPYVVAFRKVHYLFGDKDLLVIALTPRAGLTTDPHFISLVKAITDQISELPGCARPLLQGLTSRATKDIQLSTDGLRVAPLIDQAANTGVGAKELQSRLLRDPRFSRTLISDDGSSIAIYATFEPTTQLPGYVNILARVDEIIRTANGDGYFSYSFSGPVAIVAGLTTYAGRALLLFPLSLLVIGLIHFEAFRTWQAVVLPMLTGLLGVIWALGFMGLFRTPLDPVNSTTPVLILAIGTGHSVQILKRYYELLADDPNASDKAIIDALATTGTATIAASLIAAGSFLSLVTFSTASMRRFGVFTALGIASSLVIELTLIPALRASFRPVLMPEKGTTRAIPILPCGRMAEWLTRRSGAHIVLGSYCGIVVLAALASFGISTDSSFVRQFGVNNPVRTEDAYINEHFSGANVLLFMITAPPQMTLANPVAMNALREFEERLGQLPTVGHVSSVVDVLSRMHSVLAPDSPHHLPQTPELLNQYLFLYSLSGGDELYTLITPDYRTMKLVALVTEDSTANGATLIAQARDAARATLPDDFEVEIAGTIASNLALTQEMVRGKILNICQVVAITILISAAVLRSLIGGLLVALPLALAVMINFGLMGLIGIPMDVGTAAVSGMAVGIGADYAIYLIFRLREEVGRAGTYRMALQATMKTAGSAILFVATAIGCGYAILCVSGYQLYFNLGLLIATAMATSSIASLVVVPAAITALVESGISISFLRGLHVASDGELRIPDTHRHFN